MSHFFGELEPNLFFKAYYAKYYKQDTGKSIKGDFFNVLGFPLFPFLTFLSKR